MKQCLNCMYWMPVWISETMEADKGLCYQMDGEPELKQSEDGKGCDCWKYFFEGEQCE